MIKTYPSIAAMTSEWQRTATPSHSDNETKWYGGETRTMTVERCTAGDTTLVPEAEALLTSLDVNVETPRKAWDRSPAGAFCCVPDVLAGRPTAMRRQREVPDERAPITILVTTTSSAGIKAETLRKRGTVILALTMALTRIRPTSLYTLATLDGRRDGTGETVIRAQVNTTPLDLASACWALTSAGFDRRITHELGRTLNGFTGGWPRGMSYFNPKPYFKSVTDRLGLREKDTLVIHPAQLGDYMLNHPVEWVQQQINYFASSVEQDIEGSI